MSKPNVHGLPQHLTRTVKVFLDYFVKEGGLKHMEAVNRPDTFGPG